MKQLLLICAVVMVGCASTPKIVPNSPEAKAAIRKAAGKPTGELSKADYEKVAYLDLIRKQLTEVPKELEKLTRLTGLALNNNQLTSVKGLEKLNQLTRLYLDYNQLTDVKGLENLTQLKELNLRRNQLTDVTGLEKLTQLTDLNLGNNQLTELPKGLENLNQLTSLTLSGNQLTDVTGLEKLTKLTGLNLHSNPDLTKAQIAELQKALPKCRIHSNPTK